MKILCRVLIVALLLAVTSCGKIELADDNSPEETPGGEPGDGGGSTSPGGVLTVAQLASVEDDTEVSVAGYIVGYVSSRTLSNTVFSAEGAVETNLVIADSRAETDYRKCAAVQLEADTDARYELNLAANPQHLGAYVVLTGVKDRYYYAPGIRPLYTYEFATPEAGGTDDPATGNPLVYPILSSDPPAVFEGC